MSGDTADEEASGFFVQSGGTAQKARQQGGERRDGDESAIIVYEEFPAEIGVASLNTGASLAHLEIAFHIVVAQTPTPAI